MAETTEPEFVRALGFSQTEFNPFKPGRLCRGRERWITPWQLDEGVQAPTICRLVITGAAFHDDSARDALRGLPAADIDVNALFLTLFPDAHLVVFTEDGHPADIPDDAHGIELYDGYRGGGQTTLPLVRWYKSIDSADIGAVVDDVMKERINGFAIVDKDVDLDALWHSLFTLVGMSTLDSPPARYNPGALPDLLELARAIVIFHRDKHGPALGVYSLEPLDVDEQLKAFSKGQDRLLVPFAIPPMLARWDRALFELRQTWEEGVEFPVPEATTPSHWESRRNRRREHRKPKEEAAAPEEPAAEDPKAEPEAPVEPPPDLDVGDGLDAFLIAEGDDAVPATETKNTSAEATESVTEE